MAYRKLRKLHLLIRFVILAVLLIATGERDFLFSAINKNKGFDTKELRLEEVEEKAKALFKKALNEKDLKKKEKLYLKLLKLWPSYAPAYNNLADTYEKLGKFKQAIKNYEIARDLAPDAPYPYFGLGDVYFKLGEFAKAVENYQKGLRIKPDDKLARHRLKLAQILSKKIFFGFDSSKLTSEAKRLLHEMAKAMKDPELKEMVFEIAGYTDSIGSKKYNLRLSVKRANAVKEFLIKECGLSPARLLAKGYGEDHPIASNKTKQGRRMNRRVEISFAHLLTTF